MVVVVAISSCLGERLDRRHGVHGHHAPAGTVVHGAMHHWGGREALHWIRHHGHKVLLADWN